MLKYIFTPLCTSIASFEVILNNSHQKIPSCDPEFMALTVVLPEFRDQKYFSFNLSEIDRFITINNRGDIDVKSYVLERLKELGNSKRMAAFRGIPTVEGMPTDAQIIYHVVRDYLKIREPHIVPPLLPLEGDVFKFILIYVKMTPELGWNVF
ncbi:hypothetical protein BY458DRAFT_532299 [Sporodiniella umbellata]|nr:hypothetical protein BY458DRAFT_532299 [Sporodiniella umbellata]